MRAIAVLNFLLLPPLQSRHTHTLPLSPQQKRPHWRGGANSPVLPTLFVSIFGEVQFVDGGGHHFSDEGLWNTSQSGKHGQ